MAHPAEKVTAVRRSFVYERLSLEAAAEKHGVSYHTARVWKRKAKEEGDDWDTARNAARMATGPIGDITNEVLEDFVLLFQSTITELKESNVTAIQKAEALSRLSDAYTKTMKAAAQGSPQIAKLSVALEVLKELSEFIRVKFPEQLESFTVILDPFAKRASEVFGK